MDCYTISAVPFVCVEQGKRISYLHLTIDKRDLPPMKMLEYCQRILSKVSFDRHLFAKELAKSIKRLELSDVQRLRQWCQEQFGQRYQDIIMASFPAQIAG